MVKIIDAPSILANCRDALLLYQLLRQLGSVPAAVPLSSLLFVGLPASTRCGCVHDMVLQSIFRLLPRLGRSWKPLDFSSPNFVRIPTSQKIEEETIAGYVSSRYYPARLGEILLERYQIVGQLRYGTSSTVWLARDLRSLITSPHPHRYAHSTHNVRSAFANTSP